MPSGSVEPTATPASSLLGVASNLNGGTRTDIKDTLRDARSCRAKKVLDLALFDHSSLCFHIFPAIEQGTIHCGGFLTDSFRVENIGNA